MSNLNPILKDNSPQDLREYVSSCVNREDLAAKLEQDPARLSSFIEYMQIEGNEQLAERFSCFLYQLTPSQLENPEISKVETALRNHGMLNRNKYTDISIQQQEGKGSFIQAHRAVLALESTYFKAIAGFREFRQGKVVMQKLGISPLSYSQAVEWLYSSDEKRKDLISKIDRALLIDMVKLADYWQVEELKAQCDDELCNSIGALAIEKSDVPNWLQQARFHPKFAALLDFINRQAEEGRLEPIIHQMQNQKGADKLAAKCSPEEFALFSTLKTEFGKVCQIPPGTLGKAEWEKAFPVMIEDVPPLPLNIHRILEQEDPYEPRKKLKETCQLFLRLEKVILRDEDRELYLDFDGLKELALKAAKPDRRTKFIITFDALRGEMNKIPAAESGWVLIRKDVIPGSRHKSFRKQANLLKGSFEVPKLMDAAQLNILTFASKGKVLYGVNPLTQTRCQEKFEGECEMSVGGFDSYGLTFGAYPYKNDFCGLTGVWKFNPSES